MKTDYNLKEIAVHGNISFPCALYQFININHNIVITEHWHDEIELLYVQKGKLTVNINNKIYNCDEGEFIFINSGELHGINGSCVDYYAVVFNPTMLSFAMPDAVQKKAISPFTEHKITFYNKPESSPDQIRLLKYIIWLNHEKPDGYMLETKAALLMLINRLLCIGAYRQNLPSVRQEETENILKAIVTYIDENFQEKITLNDIAKEFNMSAKYFCRFFKKNFHKTFIEYLNSVRIEKAMNIFSTFNASVTVTALSCGFSNMSYFTKTFREITGFTPSEYRERFA